VKEKKGDKQDYQREKREYKKMCEGKKREENKRWKKEMEGIRAEGQV